MYGEGYVKTATIQTQCWEVQLLGWQRTYRLEDNSMG